MSSMRRALLLVGATIVAISACGSDGSDEVAPPEESTSLLATTEAPAKTSTSEPSASAAASTTSMGASQNVGCADVVGGMLASNGDLFTVSATVSSADTGWDKYADSWEVRTTDGTVLGERILTHPHVDEQPFTRSLTGVSIPGDVDTVLLVAHDSVSGFCGVEFALDVVR